MNHVAHSSTAKTAFGLGMFSIAGSPPFAALVLGEEACSMINPAVAAARGDAELERRAKTGKPYIFAKLGSCVAGPNDELVLPRDVEKPD